jgi:hypothetical protein
VYDAWSDAVKPGPIVFLPGHRERGAIDLLRIKSEGTLLRGVPPDGNRAFDGLGDVLVVKTRQVAQIVHKSLRIVWERFAVTAKTEVTPDVALWSNTL